MIFKRKKKFIDSKYKIGDFIRIRYKNELVFGFIYEIKLNDENEVIYTIQKGGECPIFIENYKEKDILGYVNK